MMDRPDESACDETEPTYGYPCWGHEDGFHRSKVAGVPHYWPIREAPEASGDTTGDGVTTLVEFLGERIAEDEAAVEFARPIQDYMPHGAWDLDRVLAECAAKRAIIEYATGRHTSSTEGYDIVRILATVYDSHPDYDPSWRP